MKTIDHPSGAKMLIRTDTVKARTRLILQQFPSARGDDRILVWRYWRAHTGIRLRFKDFEVLRSAPSPETISRRRREIQEAEPDLRPTERTVQKRERREEAYHHYYGNGNSTLGDFLE